MTEKAPTRPRYRAHQWINTDTLQTVYSIQASVGKRGWMHVSYHGEPLFFDSAAKRDAALNAINGTAPEPTP